MKNNNKYLNEIKIFQQNQIHLKYLTIQRITSTIERQFCLK